MSPIRIILLFITIVILSIATLRQLKIDLLPQSNQNSFVISFDLPNSTPAIVEQQVTAKLENAFSKLTDLKHITAVSAYNHGRIVLTFGKYANQDVKKFETAAIIRRVYPGLPATASYPVLLSTFSDNNKVAAPLLIYSIHSPYQSYVIRQFAEKRIFPQLTGIKGVKEVNLSNADKLQIVVSFDMNRCNNYHIMPEEIATALQLQLPEKYPGAVFEHHEQYFLSVSPGETNLNSIAACIIKSSPRIIRLKDVASVYFEEKAPEQFFRINGNNALNLSIYPEKGVNVLAVANDVKDKIKQLNAALPATYALSVEHDDSVFITQELNKNFRRIGIAMICLCCFMIVVYRKLNQLLLLGVVLLVSLLVALLFVRICGVDVHLYSIAGFVISFSILLDNAIVMYDYYRQYRNRQIILALIGGVLVLIAALGIIFLLPEEERANMQDFSLVIILSVLASALTNFLFTPALYEWVNKRSDERKRLKFYQLRRMASVHHVYFVVMQVLAKRKYIVVLLLLCGFGTTLWLFTKSVYERAEFGEAGQTKLYIDAELPPGNTPQAMNNLLLPFEHFLQPVKGIQKYITQISSGQKGSIQIFFTDTDGESELPYVLKSSLIQFANNFSGMKLNIYGVGRSFTTHAEENAPTFLVKMSGYDYDELDRQVRELSVRISKYKRVENINADAGMSSEEKSVMQYVADFDPQQLAMLHTDPSAAVAVLQDAAGSMQLNNGTVVDDKLYPLVIREQGSATYSIGDLQNSPGWRGEIHPEPSVPAIHRADRKYIRMLSFQYRGAENFGRDYLQQALHIMKQRMPMGYTAEEVVYDDELKVLEKRYYLGFVLLAFIYLICGVLFESLRLPFYVITIIPVSFIGIFLIFSVGNYTFDRGGYAAFILLGGLVASSSVYIINDLIKSGRRSFNRSLTRVIFNRGRTILLTTAAAICGLLPFLFEGRKEVFWYAFSIGTLGGLLFSIVAIFFVLPVFLWKNR